MVIDEAWMVCYMSLIIIYTSHINFVILMLYVIVGTGSEQLGVELKLT